LARIGWAEIVSYAAIGILTGNIGGPLQTVPRAELIAVIRALKSITGVMTPWSDCKYVVDGMHKIQYRPTLSLPKKTELFGLTHAEWY